MNNKKLNLFDLISIGIGCIIGAGVFSLMGYGIAYTGRGITAALFLSMLMVVLYSIRYPILARIFDVDGGQYAFNALVSPRMCAGFSAASDFVFKLGSWAVTALSISKYLEILIPSISPYKKLVSIVVLTICLACFVVGEKFAAKVQDLMCILMYLALGLFVVYGIMKADPSAYAGEPMFPNGFTGLMLAAAIMSYTCNGFQYITNLGKSAENPRRDIPLAFLLSAFIAAAIYALIGFAATHAYSYDTLSGMNLGNIAKMMMPTGFYTFFLVGGALFALTTSLIGAITSGYQPLVASARDGWLPQAFATKMKNGTPTVLIFLYVISVIVIILGIDLGDLATMSLIPNTILAIIINICAYNVPERFEKNWKESEISMPVSIYHLLIIISCIASATICVYCFISNSLKVPTTVITVVVFVYGYFRSKSDKVNIQVHQEFSSEK